MISSSYILRLFKVQHSNSSSMEEINTRQRICISIFSIQNSITTFRRYSTWEYVTINITYKSLDLDIVDIDLQIKKKDNK